MARRFTKMQHARPHAAGQPVRSRRCVQFATAWGRVLTATLVMGVIAGCSGRAASLEPSLPPTPIVAMRPTWALVSDSYLRLRDEPRVDAAIVGHLRYAEVAAIARISADVVVVDGRMHRWFLLRRDSVTGWVLDDRVEVFVTEARARDASRRMRERSP